MIPAESPAEPPIETGGKLAGNILHFARMLRRAGMRIGPGQTLDAVVAAGTIGVTRRDDFFWALHSVLVRRPEERELFTEAFDLFWRNPFANNEALAMLLPKTTVPTDEDDSLRRVREAWQQGAEAPPTPPPPPPDQDHAAIDMTMTFSAAEILRTKDFEQMTAEELSLSRRLIARMSLDVTLVPTRRFRPDRRGGRIDLRRTFRQIGKGALGYIPLARRSRRRRPPPLVVICDISGSMERYSRMFLHFLHALTNARQRVHAFVFGTRLTNVTRALRHRDVDRAFQALGRDVKDWSGGTRIGACLAEFNRTWSRRVLAQGAVVVLVSDGLDRDPSVDLAFEADRLHRSSRRLVWLNPLLRYAAFEPKAGGIRALLPHVDDFRPVHDLQSLEQLAEALRDL